MTAPAVVRRPFLTEPGEHLLVNYDPLAFVRRFEAFVEASGVPAERVLASPLLSIPLPVPSKGAAGGVARWAGANPSFLWHPLMWLPASLALRVRRSAAGGVDEGASNVDVESDSEWAVRVAQELIAGGLYDPETGTWLDVLAFYGIDPDGPGMHDRLRSWLHGAPDDVLDRIDLSEFVSTDDLRPQVIRAASDVTEVLVPAQWALTATGIIETVEVLQRDDEITDESRHELLGTMLQIAAVALHDVPEDPDSGLDPVDMIGLLAEENDSDDGSNSASLIEALLDLLADIAADYAIDVQSLEDFANGASQAHDTTGGETAGAIAPPREQGSNGREGTDGANAPASRAQYRRDLRD